MRLNGNWELRKQCARKGGLRQNLGELSKNKSVEDLDMSGTYL